MSELLDDLGYLDQEVPQQIYVGFWRRLAAATLDWISIVVILILWTAITALLGVILPVVIIDVFENFFTIGIMFLYLPLWECSSSQASIGKQIMSMKVVDNKGERITFWKALARFIAKFLSYTILFIGFFMIAFTDKKQGLHDFITETYVVER